MDTRTNGQTQDELYILVVRWHSKKSSPCFQYLLQADPSSASSSWPCSCPSASQPDRPEIQKGCNQRHRRGQSLYLAPDICTWKFSLKSWKIISLFSILTPARLVHRGTSQGRLACVRRPSSILDSLILDPWSLILDPWCVAAAGRQSKVLLQEDKMQARHLSYLVIGILQAENSSQSFAIILARGGENILHGKLESGIRYFTLRPASSRE